MTRKMMFRIVSNIDRELKNSTLVLTFLTEKFEPLDAKTAIRPMMIILSFSVMKNPVKSMISGSYYVKFIELK